MEEQKRHTIRVTPDTAKRLKVLAAQVGKPQGVLLETLLRMVADGKLTDEEMTRAMTGKYLRGYTHPQALGGR